MGLRPQQVAPELLNKVTKALGITALDQWYYVSHHTAKQVIGSSTINNFGGNLSSFLKYAYPQHQFDEAKLTSKVTHEKNQKFIEVIVRKLFPNAEIITKARKSVGIINPETEEYLEIDFWIPSLKLGIEYQDKHHYGYQWYAHDTLENYQKRDEIKKTTMSSLGYTLITIGYWWDKSIESVAATIKKYRPDLLREYNTAAAGPIPSEPPAGYVAELPVIPGVAGIMNPFIPQNDFDPTNWYGGEKHDGIRGVYNSDLNKMFSRSGNELSVLPALLKNIPNMLVEGEITAGRGNYNKTASVSYHTHHDNVNWSLLRYVIFDNPDSEAGNYTKRYSAITRGLTTHPFIFAQSAFRVLLLNKAHFKLLMDAIISSAGEGVIAQKDARYEYGRSKGLAKIKVRRDADAQVLHINKLSCTCKLPSNVISDIRFYDGFNPSDLKIGDIVSYYFSGFSRNGLPKRREIYKIRYDITWESIVDEQVRNSTKSRLVKEAIGSKSLNLRKIAQVKRGHWSKTANARAYFDEFARVHEFDPLVPSNWYPIRGIMLRNVGGIGLLNAYGYNLKKALSSAYPELEFELESFAFHQQTKANKGHWNKSANVRAYFNEFAHKAGFDPLALENWKTVKHSSLQIAKGSGLLSAFNYNMEKALLNAYPEMREQLH